MALGEPEEEAEANIWGWLSDCICWVAKWAAITHFEAQLWVLGRVLRRDVLHMTLRQGLSYDALVSLPWHKRVNPYKQEDMLLLQEAGMNH